MTVVRRSSVVSVPSALCDLETVRSSAGGLYASDGDHFRDAVFGRDSLEAALDLVDIRPDIVREVILAIAALQGTMTASPGHLSNEEEFGKIHHESRQLIINGRRISPESEQILDELAKRWGGTAERMVYYGTADATPLFVRLVGDYCDRYGRTILDEVLTNKNGDQVTVAQSVLRAVEWVDHRIQHSTTGLLEFLRRNPDGIEFQVWKDGKVSLIHPDGTIADFRQPIATIELQGLAYDALVLGAGLLYDHPSAGEWRDAAARLQQRTLDMFWMPGIRYFATAIDRDPRGAPRRVATVTSSPAELLDSRLLLDLPEERRRPYVEGVLTTVMGTDFVTDAGVRTTSLRHRRMVPYWQYQGAYTSWFKDTYDIARGMRRHGFGRLASQLETRLVNAVNYCGNNLEFVFVDGRGRLILDPLNSRNRARPRVVPAGDVPDKTQTWTVTAVLAIKRRRGRRLADEVPDSHWARMLEFSLLQKVPYRAPVTKRLVCLRRRVDAPAVLLDRAAGRQREAALVARQARRLAGLAAPAALQAEAGRALN